MPAFFNSANSFAFKLPGIAPPSAVLIVSLAVNFSNISPATGLPIRRTSIALFIGSGNFSGDIKSIAFPIVKRVPTAKPGSKSPSSPSRIPS